MKKVQPVPGKETMGASQHMASGAPVAGARGHTRDIFAVSLSHGESFLLHGSGGQPLLGLAGSLDLSHLKWTTQDGCTPFPVRQRGDGGAQATCLRAQGNSDHSR